MTQLKIIDVQDELRESVAEINEKLAALSTIVNELCNNRSVSKNAVSVDDDTEERISSLEDTVLELEEEIRKSGEIFNKHITGLHMK